MKKKVLLTRKQKQKRLSGLLICLIPLFLFLLQLPATVCNPGFAQYTPRGRQLLLYAGLWLSLVLSMPIWAILLVINRSAQRQLHRNSSYLVYEELDYWREILSGVSPATVSYLMDLRLEPKKDLSALLLSYWQKGLIQMEGSRITAVKPGWESCPGLRKSDTLILSQLCVGQAVREICTEAWEAAAKAEVIQEGYVSAIRISKRAGLRFARLSNLLTIGIFIGGMVLLMRSPLGQQVQSNDWQWISQAAEGGEASMVQAWNAFAAGTQAFADVRNIFLFVFFFFLILLSPGLFFGGYMARFKSKADVYRTAKGNLLTGRLSGLKNYIHDFSSLADAQKEQLVLWDDFLVYAVLLEENESIVKEILSMRNIAYDFHSEP